MGNYTEIEIVIALVLAIGIGVVIVLMVIAGKITSVKESIDKLSASNTTVNPEKKMEGGTDQKIGQDYTKN